MRGSGRPAQPAQSPMDTQWEQFMGVEVGGSLETGKYQRAPHCLPSLTLV